MRLRESHHYGETPSVGLLDDDNTVFCVETVDVTTMSSGGSWKTSPASSTSECRDRESRSIYSIRIVCVCNAPLSLDEPIT